MAINLEPYAGEREAGGFRPENNLIATDGNPDIYTIYPFDERFLDEVHRSLDLVDAFLFFYYGASSIAILTFVSCCSMLINWHHPTTWRTPTFAFALGVVLVSVWAQDWIGILPFVPGAVAWLLSCWFLHRNASTHAQHAIQA